MQVPTATDATLSSGRVFFTGGVLVRGAGEETAASATPQMVGAAVMIGLAGALPRAKSSEARDRNGEVRNNYSVNKKWLEPKWQNQINHTMHNTQCTTTTSAPCTTFLPLAPPSSPPLPHFTSSCPGGDKTDPLAVHERSWSLLPFHNTTLRYTNFNSVLCSCCLSSTFLHFSATTSESSILQCIVRTFQFPLCTFLFFFSLHFTFCTQESALYNLITRMCTQKFVLFAFFTLHFTSDPSHFTLFTVHLKFTCCALCYKLQIVHFTHHKTRHHNITNHTQHLLTPGVAEPSARTFQEEVDNGESVFGSATQRRRERRFRSFLTSLATLRLEGFYPLG